MSARMDANGKVTLKVQTLWRKGGTLTTDFPLSGILRPPVLASFEILDGNTRQVLASSVSNPALRISIIATTVSGDLSDPNFDVRNQEFSVDLAALGLGHGNYIFYWTDIARVDGINNAAGRFSLECRILFDGSARSTPEILQRINTTVIAGFPYSENLNAIGSSSLSYGFIVGAGSPRFGPASNIPGISVDAFGQVEIPASNTSDLNEDNQIGQPAADYVFKVQVTDAEGQYIEQDVLVDVVFVRVAIDIKPGSDPNTINCQNSKEVVAVAVLSTDEFDARQIDASAVSFGPARAREIHGTGHIEDVDGDSDFDMVFHFRFSETGIKCEETSAKLRGKTNAGIAFIGSDVVHIIQIGPGISGSGAHDRNDVVLRLFPNGQLAFDGRDFALSYFPNGTRNQYLFAAGPWVGGLVGGQPVVAEVTYASEFVPSEIGSTGQPYRMFNSSTVDDRKNWPPEFSTANGRQIIVSGAQNLVVQYNDVNGRQLRGVRRPLGIEIRQRSLAYEDASKRNALIFFWEVTNISSETISDAYAGFWSDHDIGAGNGFADDRASVVNNMAIIWDDDFFEPTFTEQPAIMGVHFLDSPVGSGVVNFSIFSPVGPFPNDQSNDPRQYAFLSGAQRFEVGQVVGDVRFLASTGPFTLAPGEEAVLVAALIFGRAPAGTTSLAADPVTLRPDPQDPVLAELIKLQGDLQRFYDRNLKREGLPKLVAENNSVEWRREDVPVSFELGQNYPNPFNPSTRIQYTVPEAGFVSLKVYNALGQEVAVLVEEFREVGRYVSVFDTKALPSGVYIYRITAGSFTQTKRMVLMK